MIFLAKLQCGLKKHALIRTCIIAALVCIIYFVPTLLLGEYAHNAKGGKEYGFFITLTLIPYLNGFYNEGSHLYSALTAFEAIFPTILFFSALIVCGVSIRYPKAVIGAPIALLGFLGMEIFYLIEYGYSSVTSYSAFYATLLCVLLAISVFIATLVYLPPIKPRPPHEHKPTKEERIAELEARVRELENRD